MSVYTFKPYTEVDVRNAEILLAGTAKSSLDAAVRARAKVVLALIEVLDAHEYTWRKELATRINQARASGKLLNFNPDAPFELLGDDVKFLKGLHIGPVTGASLIGRSSRRN